MLNIIVIDITTCRFGEFQQALLLSCFNVAVGGRMAKGKRMEKTKFLRK